MLTRKVSIGSINLSSRHCIAIHAIPVALEAFSDATRWVESQEPRAGLAFSIDSRARYGEFLKPSNGQMIQLAVRFHSTQRSHEHTSP